MEIFCILVIARSTHVQCRVHIFTLIFRYSILSESYTIKSLLHSALLYQNMCGKNDRGIFEKIAIAFIQKSKLTHVYCLWRDKFIFIKFVSCWAVKKSWPTDLGPSQWNKILIGGLQKCIKVRIGLKLLLLHVLCTRIHTLEQRIDVLLNTAGICLCRWCHAVRNWLKKHAIHGQKMFW